MVVGVWVLGDQLWQGQSALQSGIEPGKTPVLMVESLNHGQERPYHLQKLVLVWSAMRHFAEELRRAGWEVTYVQVADFKPALLQWIEAHRITELRLMTPTDRPFLRMVQQLDLPCPVRLIPSNRFIWSDQEFIDWAKSRKRLVMEDFYRAGRHRFQVLMAGDQPVGGRWNFDRDNRKPLKQKLTLPAARWFSPDAITRQVIEEIKALPNYKQSQQYWQIEPFCWGVTRSQALEVLALFIETRLANFGPYQDAMVTGAQTLWHGLVSPYLNLGLLHPLEVVEAAAQAYHANQEAYSLSSVEGFVRQVLGWREYMHGIYIYLEEGYGDRNWFHHTHPLPDFYWTGETEMNCLHQVLAQVKATGYAHHIQRLMVLNNFGLIAGISPQQLQNWFHAAFIDGYDWVMQANVIGMGQYADGGLVASKPYAASANYINTMSDYCKHCAYNPRDRLTEKACPFNLMYWDFLARQNDRLQQNNRMALSLRNLNRISGSELQQIRQGAASWRQSHSPS